VASVKITINACVVFKLPSLLLNKEWIRQVNLLSDFKNHKYYILGLYGNLTQVLNLELVKVNKLNKSNIISETINNN
jgi:hypothetical protein